MKSVRKFFGHLCGGSGRRAEENKGESPVSPPRENEERQVEPSLLADESGGGNENKETLKEYLAQSSYESLNESPSTRKKQNVIKAAYSVQCIYDVAEWKPENLGTAPTDKVFDDAVEILGPFFKHAQDLATLLLNFARQYSRDKKPNFQKCYQVYVKNKSAERMNTLQEGLNIMDIPDDDLQDPTIKQLKEIAVNGKRLLELIDTIRPQVDEKINELGKLDIKESGKDKKDTGNSPHGGLLSKFSAPGKFRRNLKQLKENRKILDSVYSEVESIMLTISQEKTSETILEKSKEKSVASSGLDFEMESQQTGSQTLLDMAKDTEPVCPLHINVITDSDDIAPCNTTEKTGTDGHDGKIDDVPKPETNNQISHEEQIPKVSDAKEEEVVKSADSEAQMTELQPDSEHFTELEQADVILPLRPKSPPMSPIRDRSSSLEKVDATKLLDFGSYVFVDPSANDEVILHRSRSLDSLCSVTSRKTLSRYGSYEFVTDFEIKIAEKAEDQKQQTKESTSQKKTKSKRHKKGKTTKKFEPESRGASSPIYKYTEVDYNPMGF